jgi:excisionase family DNA binding protein
MADTHGSEGLLTSRQAAKIAGVPLRRLQKWVESKRLRAVQRHPKTLIARQDLDAFLHNREPMPTPIALPDDDSLLSAEQAAEIAQVHLHTVQKWVASGRLDAVSQRPKILVTRGALDVFLRNRTLSVREAAQVYEAASAGEDDISRPLTAKQAAVVAQVRPSSVRTWVREGKLEAVQQYPLILIDRATLDAFLRDREALTLPPAQDAETEVDDTVDPAQDESAMLDILHMPAVDTPKDEVWRALVLAQQREIEAAKVREARLLSLLDAATKPTPQIPRRLKANEMTLVYRVKHYLESVGRPQRAWQVQQALKLDKPPHRELSRLVGRGEIRRLREGVYAALEQSQN